MERHSRNMEKEYRKIQLQRKAFRKEQAERYYRIQDTIVQHYTTETIRSIEENDIYGNRYEYIVTFASGNTAYIKLLEGIDDTFEVEEIEFITHSKGDGNNE